MDKTESRGVALGGRSRGEGTIGKWESQLRLGPVAGKGPLDTLQSDNDKTRARKPEEPVSFDSGGYKAPAFRWRRERECGRDR